MRIGGFSIDNFTYKMGENGEHHLEKVEDEKDIGVVIDEKLTFEKHMSEKINKANGIMGLIRRTFEYMDKEIFSLIFESLVRPHVEYANQVWAPSLRKHVEALENGLRRASKQVPGLRDLSYPERLKQLNMPTLAYRRIRGDIIEVFKIMSEDCGYDQSVCKDLLTPSQVTWTRGHRYKLEQQRPRLDLRNKIQSGERLVLSIDTRACQGEDNVVRYLEHVQAVITVNGSRRGDLNINMTSPAGTKSILLSRRPRDDDAHVGFDKWPFMTSHSWGEDPRGPWVLEVGFRGPEPQHGVLKEWTLMLHGTQSAPYIDQVVRDYQSKLAMSKKEELEEELDEAVERSLKSILSKNN
ncbi:hypothetical protein NHX12_022552 [Muraenolepis orangiensis]|uniref:P/Homo B domain-containing protein n=1 Tax=Muraenolepis orangiensis TaxID=630683 RepID=A0A9Q0ERT2_9TELE|nr:hypothetical protein NHX12_022552 [Muraenolepis orangiensis]